jgi:hypothetical protein
VVGHSGKARLTAPNRMLYEEEVLIDRGFDFWDIIIYN